MNGQRYVIWYMSQHFYIQKIKSAGYLHQNLHVGQFYIFETGTTISGKNERKYNHSTNNSINCDTYYDLFVYIKTDAKFRKFLSACLISNIAINTVSSF